MREILLVGAGKIGETIIDMLGSTGDYHVTLVDRDQAALDRVDSLYARDKKVIDVTDKSALISELNGKFAVLSAVPYFVTRHIAEAARETQCHYLDLTEDVATTRLVKSLAQDADQAFIPQCGLAPGFISIVAYDLARKFDRLQDVHMRVGALPRFPTNGLNYNLTWSTDGVINEYCQPCEAIEAGCLLDTPALGGLEEFSLDGEKYEAFNTSGGLGTLCDTLDGKVESLNYKSIRYPGHRDIMKILLQDLRLKNNQDLMRQILEQAIPMTMQDVVIIFVSVSGMKKGRLMQENYAHKVFGTEIANIHRSAIQVTTASGICALLDMLHSGALRQTGFIRQEDIPLDHFLQNRFGRHYAMLPHHNNDSQRMAS